ncbi:hypothetical protein PHMEG_00014258 [Phytophthora megakarya]|uniref:Uncharacterized protein n=1 Tax=Phytophthora megakarya TaxID=4795 RepID=A0A225W5S9_9STRA|nr:hypothetical protein PHMEG_00014258 [Phytophthora megakarya]
MIEQLNDKWESSFRAEAVVWRIARRILISSSNYQTLRRSWNSFGVTLDSIEQRLPSRERTIEAFLVIYHYHLHIM